jgi:predicted lipid-binding transport protein (Tim44 family)
MGAPIGLGGAWLALLAIQSAAGLLAPAQTLFAAALTVLGVAAFTQWGPGRRRPLPAALPQDSGSDGHEGLLASARVQFMQLQAAWDRGDEAALRALTTADMLQELLNQLPARGPGPNRTDVLSLDARVLAVEQVGPFELASIEFSGMVCESAERGAVPFRELWMLARPTEQGESWRLARHQALL